MKASVQLSGQQSASTLLHSVLLDCAANFADAFTDVKLPERAHVFRDSYPKLLPFFEAARLASSDRAAIARYLAAAAQRSLVWQDESGEAPLDDYLSTTAAALPLETSTPSGTPGWQPDIVYRGERWDSSRLEQLGDKLAKDDVVTASAAESLGWIAQHCLGDGRIHLAGRKIVALGGGAEMAPTRFWVEAGADVLWLDVAAPPADWFSSSQFAGRLSWPRENADLLTQPRRILATIIDFADGQPVDLGLYAYAPGQAREVRLTGVMNAIVGALPQALISSVTMLVSPTTPTALVASDLAAMALRQESRPAWEGALALIGALGRGGGSADVGGCATTRSVVGIQGASYQAAQYLGKIIAAESWSGRPFRVSANTAAITRTRSLDHPVFTAAFAGADAFGVQTFTPRQSRRLNGLLALADWLRPGEPKPGEVRVHGGIHTLPYPLESTLRVAAAIGFMRSPRLLKGLLAR